MLACRVVCCSHQSDCRIRVCIFHQSDCRIRVCISHQSNHSIWVSCINHSVQILFSCKLCHGIRGQCTKNDINQKFWAYLINVMIVAQSSEAEIYRDMKGSHIFHCIIFELKDVFSASFLTTHMSNNLHSITYYENNVQSPIRTYPIIVLHEPQAVFQMLELYSTNQIPFCHIRLRSITCHFLVNNLHFITHSSCTIQYH